MGIQFGITAIPIFLLICSALAFFYTGGVRVFVSFVHTGDGVGWTMMTRDVVRGYFHLLMMWLN